MKDAETIAKAQAMFMNNIAQEKIALDCGVSVKAIQKWTEKYNWKELREKAITMAAEKAPEKFQRLMEQQISIGDLAQDLLLNRLKHHQIAAEDIKLIQQEFSRLAKSSEGISKAEFLQTMDTLREKHKELFTNIELIQIEKHTLDLARPKDIKNFNLTQNNSLNFENAELLTEYIKELRARGTNEEAKVA